ncbi:MAG: hypothetical protein ACQEP3_00905 [Patescibacteria group bacterium]
MAIDIKPENKKSFDLPDSFNVLFYYSIILLLFSISGYLLISQWNSEMQSQIKNREEILVRLQDKEEFNKNKKVIANHKKNIDDYSHLFWNRRDLDNFFLFLENAIHPLAHLNSIDLNAEEGKITLSGSILDFTALEQQYTILKNFKLDREITGWVKMDSVERIDEDKVKFKNNFVELYQSPVTQQTRASLEEKDSREATILQEINSDDYHFDGLGAEGNLIKGDWYEVSVIQNIEPIKEVELAEISETDNELGVNFNINIQVDQNIFKP